ncbi:MAG: LuxR C-terminal-related transcriptional regulator, partial [Actinomycetota bacterium]|nr:LuxR C-terminal-related transcriptional regulator [Actinomycetota bacterium]
LADGPAALSAAVFDGALLTDASSAEADRVFGLMHGLYWLIANLAALGPLALIVDDAHWSDERSLRALAYLARRLDGLPIVLILAARPTVEESPNRSGLSELRADRDARWLEPGPLTIDGAAELIASLGGAKADPEGVATAYEVTRGNPYMLVELVQAFDEAEGPITAEAVAALTDSAPESLASATMLRLGELGPDAISLARAVAVLGDDGDLAHLCALSDLERPVAIAAAAKLIGAHILLDDRCPRFVHPLLRAAVYQDLSALERAYAHECAARVLMRFGAAPGRIAAHLLLSSPNADPSVAERLRVEAQGAMRMGAPMVAANYLRRALAEPPREQARGDVLLELGCAELEANEPLCAAGHLRAALELLRDPPRRADAALALASALVITEGNESAICALDANAVGLDGEPAFRIDVERTSLALYDAIRAAAAVGRMKEWSQLAGGTATERLALAMGALARAFDPSAAVSDALPLALRALADGRLVAEKTADAPQVGNAGYVLLFAEDLRAVERENELAFADARARGSALAFMKASLGACMCGLMRGELVASIAHGEATLSMWPEVQHTLVAARWCSTAVRSVVEGLVERGDAGRAQELVSEWVGVGDLDSPELGMIRVARGLVAIAGGDHERALVDFLFYGEMSSRVGYEDRTTPWRLLAAQSASALGRDEHAVQLADDAVEIARTWGAAAGLGGALRVRALVAPQAEACERLAGAVATLERSVGKLEMAKGNFALGVALLRSGLRTEGRVRLERALDGATRCGALPLVARTRAELKVAGARPRRLLFSGIESLTASELRVAQMAAAEMTNRRIAQDLFVTPKTVESHLSRVYRKLDVSSRKELAVLLGNAEAADLVATTA